VETAGFKIDCSPELLKKIEEHCFSRTDVEVGGFLLGVYNSQSATVTHVLPAKHTAQGQTQLTFTHQSWDAVYAEMKEIGDDPQLVGWYHSHPNFGVFLSEYDEFIQTNFFGSDGQVTIVVDPVRGKRGWFFSLDSKVQPLGKEVSTDLKGVPKESKPKEAPKTKTPISSSESSVSLGRIIAISALTGVLTLLLSTFIYSNRVANLERDLADLQQQILIQGLFGSSGIGAQEDPNSELSNPETTTVNTDTSTSESTG
jgi:proteasome lid subunit RPN8/RPN11